MKTMTHKHIDIDSWQLTTTGAKLYSADAVIDAYLKGKMEGLQQSQKVQVQQLEKNIQIAGTHTGKLMQYLKGVGIIPLSAYLKINSIDRLKVLLIIPENDFISDQITDVYDHISSIEQTVSEELYRISFSVTYKSEGFNNSLLASDGFVLGYKPDAKEKVSN